MRKIKVTDQNKPWNRTRRKPRPYALDSREPAKVFLIICEGVNTEPHYFKAFPLANAQVEAYGLGRTKTQLVNLVLDQCEREGDTDKEVWVVFDMDLNPEQANSQREDFNQAVKLAEQAGLKVAYSNDAFELWFLLHFQALSTPLTRQAYYEKLSRHLACSYEREAKQHAFSRQLYRRLAVAPNASQTQAIARARALHEQQAHLPSADQNPCTKVFELVAALGEYL